jgi:hypothetical protein
LGQEDVRPRDLPQRAAAGRREGGQRNPCSLAQTDHRLGAANTISSAADDVRSAAASGLQWYWKGDFVRTLPYAAIDAHLKYTAEAPSVISGVHLYPIDGAVHRHKPDATAWNHRDVTWSMGIVAVDPDPAKTPTLKKWARDYWQAVHPFNLDAGYANFMMDDEGEARVKATHGQNYERLAMVKRKYDPPYYVRK